MKMKTKFIYYAILILALPVILIVTGCSKNVYVEGTVKYTDGTPLDQGMVAFENDSVFYHSYITKNGKFSPGEYKDGSGIPKGKYRVFVTSADDNNYEHVAKKYTNSKTSGFEFDIQKKTTGIELVVEHATNRPITPPKKQLTEDERLRSHTPTKEQD
jgi:hypothetical protein